ncbi:MAG: methyltransferase domain-containing protein [Flavobacteriales bacterium]|nr:methyltransferase domain-containing protein [Flavobacteriales bacterium]
MKHQKINNCPSCDSSELLLHVQTKDHYFSNEAFDIIRCSNCQLGITNPQPDKDHIGEYYDSENYISHGTKKQGLFERLYKFAQTLNFRDKLSLIRSLSSSPKLLDYGAGNGSFVNSLIKKGVVAEGVEPNAQARENALVQFGLKLHSDIPEKKFDIITMWHVLEHIHDLKNTLKNILDHLNPNGHLLIAVPNYESKDAKHYGSYWAAYDVPRHLWHFNETSISLLMGELGAEYISKRPMKLDAFYVSILSERFKKKNAFFALLRGLCSNLMAGKNTPYSSQTYVFKKHA